MTDDYTNSKQCVDQVDGSAVLVNTSTRSSDGNQLGLGAGIGIRTTRLRAYRPAGVEGFTTAEFNVLGDGEVRE